MQVLTSLWRPSCLPSSTSLLRIALLLTSLLLAYSLLPLSPLPAFSFFKADSHFSPLSPPSASPTSLHSPPLEHIAENSSSIPSSSSNFEDIAEDSSSIPPSGRNSSKLDVLPPSSRNSSNSDALLDASVVFRNAPWKAHVGQWLSQCYINSLPLLTNEPIFNKTCPNQCNHQGTCNHADGQCRCFHGYAGPGCRDKLELECNLEASTEWPYGRWVVSICSAHCDKRRAMCFCGSGTKYPERPVAESCGFKQNGMLTDWAKPDWDSIFANESEKYGWCNVDPIDRHKRYVKVKEQCDCKYDCTWGRFCEIATQCVCINQCSGNGVCKGGSCQCREGWYGIDCSIPSPQIATRDWPKWLQPGEAPPFQGGESPSVDVSSLQGITVSVQKTHPLIYVYDLPPEFNSHLLEGRHWKYQCVNRIYERDNATIWIPQLYGAEIALYESLLNSPHRTANAEEADFFYVPVLGACLIARADETPHLSMKNFMGLRSYITLDFYRQAYFHISQSYPYWNRTSGRDHIWFFSWDEGACYAPKEIWNSMMLVHWGNTNAKYNYSTTGYHADNWDHIPIAERGDHPCFDPEKDLVLPAWKVPDPGLVLARLWERPREERKTLFYFNGNLGNAYDHGRPETSYSMGIRQKLAQEFGSSPNKDGLLGKQATKEVIVTSVRSNQYADELASSKFCGVLPGDGWSGRMEDSILHGCIPVIIQDGIQLIYENVLEYQDFAIRIKEDEIPQLVNILRAINETQLDSMLYAIQKLWQRFIYRDSILIEAQRQEKEFNKSNEWARTFSTLVDDDALSTFLQVLHYKLYNDAWRLAELDQRRKRSSLPQACEVI